MAIFTLLVLAYGPLNWSLPMWLRAVAVGVDGLRLCWQWLLALGISHS